MEQTSETVATVRGLKPADLEAVIALDARIVGPRREEFFRIKLQQNLQETGIKVSLAAEMDGMRRIYANPLTRAAMTFVEIFPVGFLISLVTAALVRMPKFLPARSRAQAA